MESEADKSKKAKSPEPRVETEIIKSPRGTKLKIPEEPEQPKGKSKRGEEKGSRSRSQTKEEGTAGENARMKSPAQEQSTSRNENLAEKLGLKITVEKGTDKSKGKKGAESPRYFITKCCC